MSVWITRTISAIKTRKGDVTVSIDEQPGNARPEKIPSLRAAFKKDGTITAANSSSISDGGAALILMSESKAKAEGLTPLCRIVAHSTHSQKPSEFTVAPVGAMNSVLEKAGDLAALLTNLEENDVLFIDEIHRLSSMVSLSQLLKSKLIS